MTILRNHRRRCWGSLLLLATAEGTAGSCHWGAGRGKSVFPESMGAPRSTWLGLTRLMGMCVSYMGGTCALVHRGQETSQCTGLNGSDPGGWGLGIEGHGQHMAGRASRQAPKWAQCEGTRWRTPEVDCAHETQSSGGDGRHPPGRQ